MIVYQKRGLYGLELWHGLTRGGATLYQLRESKLEYFQGLRSFLLQLHTGNASTEEAGDTNGLKRAAGFARMILCGGGTLDPALGQIFLEATLPFAVEIDRQGQFAARRGALRIFSEMGWQNGAALDLGQTHLKVITPRTEVSLPRDPDLLPLGRDSLHLDTARERLRGFVRDAMKIVRVADGIVLALPVALDCEGVARPGSYPGLAGPVQPIFEDLFPAPWIILNDAVLAAVGFCPSDSAKTLVVTLGFGVGGALWDR